MTRRTPTVPSAGRWYRPTSLGGRLLLWLSALYLVAAATSGWATYDNYGRTVRLFMDDQMKALAASYGSRTGGYEFSRPSDESPFRWGAFIVQVWTLDGRLVSSSRPDILVPLQRGSGHHTVSWRDATGGDLQWRVFTSTPEIRSDPACIVQMAQSESFLGREVTQRALYAAVPVALGFNRFFRMPGSAGGGSGLGLAIAQAAAQRQGLRLALLPRPDAGSGTLARVEFGGVLGPFQVT